MISSETLMVNNNELSKNTLHQIMKAFKGVDLGTRGRGM